MFARVLLHVARQPRIAPMDPAVEPLTQAGIVAALGTSLANISHALKRLVDGGALQAQRSHVDGRRQRVKIYQLTGPGETLVRHIRDGMRR